MYAFSNASCKVAGAVLVSAAFGASFGFGVEPFGSVGFGFVVSAGFGASFGFGVEPFGSVGFGFVVSAGLGLLLVLLQKEDLIAQIILIILPPILQSLLQDLFLYWFYALLPFKYVIISLFMYIMFRIIELIELN